VMSLILLLRYLAVFYLRGELRVKGGLIMIIQADAHGSYSKDRHQPFRISQPLERHTLAVARGFPRNGDMD